MVRFVGLVSLPVGDSVPKLPIPMVIEPQAIDLIFCQFFGAAMAAILTIAIGIRW